MYIEDSVSNAAHEPERDYIECDVCCGPIYREDARYEGDDVYEIDGLQICEDCIQDYLKDHRRALA